jgi:hypothetical protein
MQAFGCAFCIGKLLPKAFYLLLLPSVTVAEEGKLIDGLYRCIK